MKKRVSVIILVLIFLMVLCSCKKEPEIYTIYYDANGATGGNVPTSQTKTHGSALSLAANTGILIRDGYSFGGWNTAADGSGTLYKPGETFTSNENKTLYARWIAPIGMTTVLAETTTITGSEVDNPEDKVFRAGRNVTLSPYEMAKYEVTQELYEQVMGINPSHFKGTANPPASEEIQKLRPVETVSWFDAVNFCNELTKLNMTAADCVYSITNIIKADSDNPESSIYHATVTQDLTKKGYRLPTEAEWECAARGGVPSSTSTDPWNYIFAGSNTLNDVAWHSTDWQASHFDDDKTHQVGMLSANALGLYDMSGNVGEWCWDWDLTTIPEGSVTNPTGPATGDIRTWKGSSYEGDYEDMFKVFYRSAQDEPSLLVNCIGFRICRTTEEKND